MIYRNVFLDTNILVDYCVSRDSSEETIKLIEKYIDAELDIYISVSSVCTLMYLCEKWKLSNTEIRQLLMDTSEIFSLLSSPSSVLRHAAQSSFHDMEDAIMYFTALENNCDSFITRNTKDFPKPLDIPVLTPSLLLKEMIHD